MSASLCLLRTGKYVFTIKCYIHKDVQNQHIIVFLLRATSSGICQPLSGSSCHTCSSRGTFVLLGPWPWCVLPPSVSVGEVVRRQIVKKTLEI